MDEKFYCDYETKPMGGGNPYYCCVHCERTDPEINGRLGGHAKDCWYRLTKEAELAAEACSKSTKSPMFMDAIPKQWFQLWKIDKGYLLLVQVRQEFPVRIRFTHINNRWRESKEVQFFWDYRMVGRMGPGDPMTVVVTQFMRDDVDRSQPICNDLLSSIRDALGHIEGINKMPADDDED